MTFCRSTLSTHTQIPVGFAAGFLTDVPAFTVFPATGLAVGFEEGLVGVTFFGGIMN